MSYNENWPRNITSSAMDYLDSNLDGKIYIEGEDRDTNTVREYVELRVDGPWAVALPDDYWLLTFDVNVLCVVSNKDNLYRMQDLTGKVAKLLATNISITDSNLVELGCATLNTKRRRRLEINNFGATEINGSIMQSTVEAHHKITLKGV